MKLCKKLALLTTLASSFVFANEMEILAQKQVIANDTKVKKYIGDVRISFADNNQPETKAAVMRVENGHTVIEGNVEITLNNAVAMADKLTYTVSNDGVVAQMDKVTFTFK
jgi:lipopolysaccharide export system protein LptA